MSRLPALFVSHGSPMTLVQDSPARRFLAGLGGILPRPRAILAVSAHWTTARTAVSNAARPQTIHDFYGFPPELYQFRYDAPGAPELARQVAALTEAEEEEYGLDHGAWVPLLLGWPGANIPVVQLSVQPQAGPAHHHDLGRKLAGLRGDGVLILASGALTHNLRAYFSDDPRALSRSQGFADWMAAAVSENRVDDLLAYRTLAPDAAFAHPTDEHLLPLYVALGSGGSGRILHRSLDGTMAMDAYAWE